MNNNKIPQAAMEESLAIIANAKKQLAPFFANLCAMEMCKFAIELNELETNDADYKAAIVLLNIVMCARIDEIKQALQKTN